MLKYWIWLSTRQNVSGAQAIVLLSRFGSAVAIYQADEEALKRGSDASVPPSLLDKSLTGAEVILQQCYQKNIHVMTIQDAQYPARLRTIDDPPIVLYYKGVFPAIDTSPVIAMVGTRKASAYGLMQAKRLGYQVAKSGGIVVSGGADGIDTMCLTGALTADRPVIAVLGCGVDICYPRENEKIYAEIAEKGLLLSQFPPGMEARPYTFPQRNRVIAGLAEAVTVVEAGTNSGALITAEHAAALSREIFAVPGNITSSCSLGCNKLLMDGASPIAVIDDIFLGMGLTPAADPQETAALGRDEQLVYRLIQKQGETSIDFLCQELQKDSIYVTGILSVLEIKGLVAYHFGKIFIAKC